MARQHWSATGATARGRVLLLHGLSSIADSWWQVGPALAGQGWDVTAVDQAGHGGRPLTGPVTLDLLVDAVLDVHSTGPDVLIGHSMGTLTALALLQRHPRWASAVILEEPGSVVDTDDVAHALARTIRADAASVRADRDAITARVARGCPSWAAEDVHWAVEGIAQMQAEPFARWFDGTDGPRPRFDLADRALAVDPVPYLLAARGGRSFADGGSALQDPDRAELAHRLPRGRLLEIEGGHCLHRDAPEQWLTAVTRILH